MSKDRQEQAGALLSAEEIAKNQAERDSEAQPDPPPELPPSPNQQNQDSDKKDVDEKAVPARSSKLTVDQYLKYAPQGDGVGGLVRSLYKTKVMSFEEWESTVKTLLKKQVR